MADAKLELKAERKRKKERAKRVENIKKCVRAPFCISTIQYGEFVSHVECEDREFLLAELETIKMMWTFKIIRILKQGQRLDGSELQDLYREAGWDFSESFTA